MPVPLHGGVRINNHDRTCDRRDAWVGSISDLKRITSVALVARAKAQAEAKAKASTRAKWRALPSARSSTLKKYLTPPALSETPGYINYQGGAFGMDVEIAIFSVRTVVRLRSHCRLASARGGQHFVKSYICAQFCEQRIGKQMFVRAIVLLDRTLEQRESRLLPSTVCEGVALVIPLDRVGLGII